jgi:hypothetical protein
MAIIKSLIVAFLLVNALFWGLATHGAHCRLGSSLGIRYCVQHKYHMVFGILAFVAAVFVQHSHGNENH